MRWVVVLHLFIVSVCSFADEQFEHFAKYGETPADERYERNADNLMFGDVELGFIVTTGNTNTSSVKFQANLMQDLNHWRNQFKFDSLLKRENASDQGLSAARYFTSMQSNYLLLDAHDSLFIYGDYEYDKFSGIEKQSSLVTGFGWRFIDSDIDKVDVDLGPGLNYQVSEENVSNLGYLLRLALQWERQFNEYTRFNQNVSAEHSFSGLNSRVKSETSLVSQISGALSLKLSYLYRYNTRPDINKGSYDAETSATFVFNFN